MKDSENKEKVMERDFEEIRCSNGRYMFAMRDKNHLAYYKNYIVKTNDICIDEDWKTFIAQNKNLIPKGTVFEKWEIYKNLYGIFIDVIWEDKKYSLDTRYVEFHKKDSPSFI